MLRKLFAFTVVLALPISAIGSLEGSASASPAPVDASQYTVSCLNFSGVMQFRPRIWGGLGPFTGNVKGKVTGCTAVPYGGGTPVVIKSGKVSGPLTIDVPSDLNSDCGAMIGYPNRTVYSTTGTLTVQWKTPNKDPALSSGNTLIESTNLISQNVGGALDLSVPGSPDGVSSSGSFAGTDSGASDLLSFAGEPVTTIFHQCFTPPGITKIWFLGTPLSLG